MSVVVPVHNRSAYLADALDSILAQTYRGPLEVIVVDDGSDRPVSDEFQGPYAQVRFVRQDHLGLGAARQHGSRLATGELIGYLDDDDLWHRDKLDRQVGFLQEHPELSAVCADIAYLWGEHAPTRGLYRSFALYRTAPHRRVDDDHRVFLRGALVDPVFRAQPFFAQPLLIRPEALAAIGGWNEDARLYSECFDFYYRLTSSYEIGYVDAPLVDIRRGHDHMTADNAASQIRESLNLVEWVAGLGGVDRATVAPRLARRFARIAYQMARARHLVIALQHVELSVRMAWREPIATARQPWRRAA